MILVDSSIWIEYSNGKVTRQTDVLADRDFYVMVNLLGLEIV